MSAALTPDQILRVATAHILNGIDQHHLAALMGVNSGRIAEAVKAIEYTMANHMRVYHVTRGKLQIVEAEYGTEV